MFHYVININYIASASMEPTLIVGDIEISNKMSYATSNPKRGDIISFYSRELNQTMGKRVIGVAGDEISFKDGNVYINGQILDESDYLYKGTKTYGDQVYNVPEGCVFVLGDNRSVSRDSRGFDNPYINISDIKDRHIFSIKSIFRLHL